MSGSWARLGDLAQFGKVGTSLHDPIIATYTVNVDWDVLLATSPC